MSAPRLGFSLVEVVVVLSLLGIIAAAVAPAIGRLGANDDLATAANGIASLVRAVRLAALEEGRPVALTVSPPTRRYAIEAEDTSGIRVLAEGVADLGPNATLLGDRPHVRFGFDRLGASPPESIVVRVAGRVALVGVEGWSGEPYVRLGPTQ